MAHPTAAAIVAKAAALRMAFIVHDRALAA
jgi:hypothetical protein